MRCAYCTLHVDGRNILNKMCQFYRAFELFSHIVYESVCRGISLPLSRGVYTDTVLVKIGIHYFSSILGEDANLYSL